MSTEEAEGVKQAGGQVMRATGKAGYVRNFPAPTVLVRVDRLFWSERPDHEREPVAGMVVEKQGRTMDALAAEAPDDPPDAPWTLGQLQGVLARAKLQEVVVAIPPKRLRGVAKTHGEFVGGPCLKGRVKLLAVGSRLRTA